MEASQKYRPMLKAGGLLSPRFGYRQTTPLWQGGLKGSLAKGSWHGEAVTEGFYSRHLPKRQANVECYGLGIPPPRQAGAPPFGKGGLKASL